MEIKRRKIVVADRDDHQEGRLAQAVGVAIRRGSLKARDVEAPPKVRGSEREANSNPSDSIKKDDQANYLAFFKNTLVASGVVDSRATIYGVGQILDADGQALVGSYYIVDEGKRRMWIAVDTSWHYYMAHNRHAVFRDIPYGRYRIDEYINWANKVSCTYSHVSDYTA